MSWLSKWIGTDKALDTIDKTVGHIASGLDNLHFTDEEKSEASLKVVDAQIKFVELQRDESSIRSRARRWLAAAVVCPSILYTFGAAVLYKIDEGYSAYLMSLVIQWWWPVLAVIGFYFGVHMLRGLNGGKK